MADSDMYIRVAPYNPKTGALAARVTVGGRLFEEGEWYILSKAWGEKLSKLRQESGAPYFDIMSHKVFQETARNEMAAAMTAAGLGGLAMQGATEMPKPNVHKEGPVDSEFAGLEDASKTLEMGTAIPAPPLEAEAPAPTPDPAPAPAAKPDPGAVVSSDVSPTVEPGADAGTSESVGDDAGDAGFSS